MRGGMRGGGLDEGIHNLLFNKKSFRVNPK